jgi:hypothetical protein
MSTRSNLRKSLDVSIKIEKIIGHSRKTLVRLMVKHGDLDDLLVEAMARFCQVLEGAESVFYNQVVPPLIEDLKIFGKHGLEKQIRVEVQDDE